MTKRGGVGEEQSKEHSNLPRPEQKQRRNIPTSTKIEQGWALNPDTEARSKMPMAPLLHNHRLNLLPHSCS